MLIFEHEVKSQYQVCIVCWATAKHNILTEKMFKSVNIKHFVMQWLHFVVTGVISSDVVKV